MRDLLAMVGSPVVQPVDDERVSWLGASRLVSAATFAAGLSSISDGMDAGVVLARRVVARIGAGADIPPRELVRATGASPRSVRRHSAGVADPRLERATRLRLALEEAVRVELLGSAAVQPA